MKSLFTPLIWASLLVATLAFSACDKETGNGTGRSTGGGIKYRVSLQPSPLAGGYVLDQQGNRNSSMEYAAGTNLELTAVANSGYTFDHWENGSTTNPRNVTVTKSAEYTAYFTNGNGGDPNPNPGLNSVVFGNYTWSNVYLFNGKFSFYSQYNNSVDDYLFENANATTYSNYPWIFMVLDNASTMGSTSISCGSTGTLNGYYMLEYCESSYLYSQDSEGNTTYYGDWWGKSGTVNITKFHSGTQTLSFVVNAVMFDARAVFVNKTATVDNAPTKTLTIIMNDVSWEQYQATKKVVERIAPPKVAGTLFASDCKSSTPHII